MYFEHEYTVKIKGNSTKAIIADLVDQIELGIYYQLGDDIEEMEIDVKEIIHKDDNGMKAPPDENGMVNYYENGFTK